MTPILGFIAHSGTGKTTLLTQLIPTLKKHNIRVAVIKHAHHNVEIDKPGKDSYRLRKSGADQMIISTNERVAYIKETPAQAMSFEQTVAMLDHSIIDLVLIEGFKNENYDKIELYRASQNKRLYQTIDIVGLIWNHCVALERRCYRLTGKYSGIGRLTNTTAFHRQDARSVPGE